MMLDNTENIYMRGLASFTLVVYNFEPEFLELSRATGGASAWWRG